MSLVLKDVSYLYESDTNMQVKALNNINMSVDECEFIAIIGKTGSGKSTLVQLMNGILEPSNGYVFFSNEDINKKASFTKRDYHFKVGMVFQYPENQLFGETVLKDVMFGPKNQGYSDEEAGEKAKYALEMLNIDKSYYDRSPFELSGGEKRRVAIAGVLAMNPEILILDEPAAGLDPVSKNEVLDAMTRLNIDDKKTIIFVSHSMDDVSKYAERVIVMDEGMIIMDDNKRNVFKRYKELEAIGLSAPTITYLMDRLSEEGFNVDKSALTIDEAMRGMDINA